MQGKGPPRRWGGFEVLTDSSGGTSNQRFAGLSQQQWRSPLRSCPLPIRSNVFKVKADAQPAGMPFLVHKQKITEESVVVVHGVG